MVGFSSDLPADVIAIWLKPLSGSQPTSLRLCRQLPARSGGGTLGHRGREEFSPFIGSPNKTSISKSVNGGSSAGRRSGRSAPLRTLPHHVERYGRRQFLTGISKDRWRTPLEVMFQRGSAGRSRHHTYRDRDLVGGARPMLRHSRVVEVPPACFGLKTHMACFGGLCGQTVFWHRRPPNNNDIGRSVG